MQIKHIANAIEATKVCGEFYDELKRAQAKFPMWPEDVIHGVAIMAEESGEAVQAAIDYQYGDASRPDRWRLENLREELLQTGAMALRMILYIDRCIESMSRQ